MNIEDSLPILCPFCGEQMIYMYFVVGSGIWGSHSKEVMDAYGKVPDSPEEKDCLSNLRQESPIHCIIGNQGYRTPNEKWPKEGWFCMNNTKCLTVIIKPTPH